LNSQKPKTSGVKYEFNFTVVASNLVDKVNLHFLMLFLSKNFQTKGHKSITKTNLPYANRLFVFWIKPSTLLLLFPPGKLPFL